MENIKGSLIKSKVDKNDTFIIKIDLNTKDMLKNVVLKLLNHISGVVEGEQFFCQEFFNLKTSSANTTGSDANSLSVNKFNRTNSSASMLSSSTNSSKQQNDSKNET